MLRTIGAGAHPALVISLSIGLLAGWLFPLPATADSLFPLGDKVTVQKLKDEYVPFKGLGEIPGRPPLLLELGDPFLGTGKLDAGFEVPILGAVWQPRLWSYLINRTAVQSFDNGAPGRERDTEIANRMDWFFNLQLTGTEKILLGLRPFDQNQPGRFSRYTFDGADEGVKNELNIDIETLFFEGDLGSLIPNLDRAGLTPLDFGFTVGRQPITFQEGIIINDTIDAVGLVRNNIVFPGTSNLRISGMYAWNRLDRNDRARGVDIAARPVGRRAGPRLPAAPLPRAQLQALALAQTLPRPSCDHGPQARQGAAQRDPGTERDRAGWRP